MIRYKYEDSNIKSKNEMSGLRMSGKPIKKGIQSFGNTTLYMQGVRCHAYKNTRKSRIAVRSGGFSFLKANVRSRLLERVAVKL